ncbi:MAG: class I mannose-6-phosphate isomerase [Phycisphaerae bacterium]
MNPDWNAALVRGRAAVTAAMARALLADLTRLNRPVILAIDGYKASRFTASVESLSGMLTEAGVDVSLFNINLVFYPQEHIQRIIQSSLTDDPHFGRVYDGHLEDFMDPVQVHAVTRQWEALRHNRGQRRVVICYGMGAAAPALAGEFDRVAYMDITREQILIRADHNELCPIGSDTRGGFPWKTIYYVEYPVLNRHKKRVLRNMDWYIEASNSEDPKLLPLDLYRALMVELSGMPIGFKVFYMPGMWGGSEFGKRFKVPGLPNTSWDYEISVGDSHLLVDPGNGIVLEIQFYNVLWEQPLRLVGAYSWNTYPDHFPIAIYLQDGYFAPENQADFTRTHMPHHLHPDTAYCRRHFNEPLGRYETYYIVRADPGACTIHGFKNDANIAGYVEQVRTSARLNRPFDWRQYLHEHPSKTGELHQIPPGTVHGTGGRQIVLEIDTNPSRESTEYSFFIYDYCRNGFNYEKLDFTGKPVKLQIEHGLAEMRRHRKQKFTAEKLRPAPICIRQGSDWREMSFPMYYNMPYQVNRLEFTTRVEDCTGDMFHCLSLTMGSRVRVSSQRDPTNSLTLEDCDTIVLPACFGNYVCENLGTEPCHIVKTFLITEPRDHIDKAHEEKDFRGDE